MNSQAGQAVCQSRLARQAEVYKALMLLALHNRNVSTFTTMGLTDEFPYDYSFWMQGYGHPFLFDDSYDRKPAYNALHDALSGN